MTDFTGTTTVNAPAPTLFDYLSDVGNLPRYFSRMTSASPGEGDEVKTTAQLPDGQQVQGDAWFRVKEAEQRLEWGSEGPSSYSGYLQVTADGDNSQVEVHLHTSRVEDDDPQVQDGIDETLANIKRPFESERT